MNTIKMSVAAIALVLMSFSTNSSQNASIVKTVSASPIVWKSEIINVGEIPQGQPKVIEFEFTNIGKSAVIITNVQGSCGCTVTDYVKDPIAAGKATIIKATFNAANKGAFSKTVTVTTNAEQTPKVLTFKGTVI